MRFSRGDWTHEAFVDVFLEVQKVQYQDSKRIKVRGIWWNLGWTGTPWPLSHLETVVIKEKEFSKWKRLPTRVRTVPEVA